MLGDVRGEIHGFTGVAGSKSPRAAPSWRSAPRPDDHLHQTGEALLRLDTSVRNTVPTTRHGQRSAHSFDAAGRGSAAIAGWGVTMDSIRQSSARMSEIIGTIEGVLSKPICWP